MDDRHIRYLVELVRKDVASYRKPGTHFGQSEKAIVEEMNNVIAELRKLRTGD